MHEAFNNGFALQRVRDFGMELHTVKLPCLVGHSGNRRGGIVGDDLEATRQGGDFIAMAHPDIEKCFAIGIGAILNIAQQRRMAAGAHFRIAELALGGIFYSTAQLRRHGLHAVANAQYGYT